MSSHKHNKATPPLLNKHLYQWQQAFTQSLLSDLQPTIENDLSVASTDARQQRFAIYQNNVFYSLSNALADLYPVVKRLVGDDFFTGTATFYLREHPPQQAAMVHFGQDFAHFLREFEHTATMPYLASVAELELARHRAYHAPDCDSLDANDIALIPPEELAASVFTFHPSIHLLASDYPIFSIWQANQDSAEEDNNQESIQLDEPQYVLVVRLEYEVSLYQTDVMTYHLISALHRGELFQTAIEATMTYYPECDISQIVHFLIEQQLITAINSNNNNE